MHNCTLLSFEVNCTIVENKALLPFDPPTQNSLTSSYSIYSYTDVKIYNLEAV